jgi:putative FmdB family regulatory protein
VYLGASGSNQEDDVPTYVYACTDCGHTFEVHQSFSDDALTTCPNCSGKLRKVFNSVGIVFKGSGFYRNDSRSGSGSGSGKAEAATAADSSASPAASPADSSGASSSSNGSSTPSSSSSKSSSSAGSAA